VKKQAPKKVATEVAAVSTDFASEANSINQMHRKLELVGLQTLERMFQIGERLVRIKEQLPHGRWEQWVDDHLKFTSRTARRYIRAFKHRHDALAAVDPVLFLEEIQGKTEPKSYRTKRDTGVRFDGETSTDPEINKQLRKQKLDRQNLGKNWIRVAADAPEAIEQLIDLQNRNEWLEKLELALEQRCSKLTDRLLTIEAALGLITRATAVDLPHVSPKD
jgi:hypothetical protein